jgi:hypothetical protein
MQVDMSDKAITGRLKRVEQLRRLCLSLAKARPLAPSPPKATTEQAQPQDNTHGQHLDSN